MDRDDASPSEGEPMLLPVHLRRRNPLFVALTAVAAVFMLFLLEAFVLSDFVPDGFAAWGGVREPVVVADAGAWLPASQVLRFRPDGRFQIAVFEDLHFGEGIVYYRVI